MPARRRWPALSRGREAGCRRPPFGCSPAIEFKVGTRLVGRRSGLHARAFVALGPMHCSSPLHGKPCAGGQPSTRALCRMHWRPLSRPEAQQADSTRAWPGADARRFVAAVERRQGAASSRSSTATTVTITKANALARASASTVQPRSATEAPPSPALGAAIAGAAAVVGSACSSANRFSRAALGPRKFRPFEVQNSLGSRRRVRQSATRRAVSSRTRTRGRRCRSRSAAPCGAPRASLGARGELGDGPTISIMRCRQRASPRAPILGHGQAADVVTCSATPLADEKSSAPARCSRASSARSCRCSAHDVNERRPVTITLEVVSTPRRRRHEPAPSPHRRHPRRHRRRRAAASAAVGRFRAAASPHAKGYRHRYDERKSQRPSSCSVWAHRCTRASSLLVLNGFAALAPGSFCPSSEIRSRASSATRSRCSSRARDASGPSCGDERAA